jgi:hypothetical protein
MTANALLSPLGREASLAGGGYQGLLGELAVSNGHLVEQGGVRYWICQAPLLVIP